MPVLTEDKIDFELRSTGDFDVSKIAVKYGGGGHMNAAGFPGENFLDFNSIIMEKIITKIN